MTNMRDLPAFYENTGTLLLTTVAAMNSSQVDSASESVPHYLIVVAGPKSARDTIKEHTTKTIQY